QNRKEGRKKAKPTLGLKALSLSAYRQLPIRSTISSDLPRTKAKVTDRKEDKRDSQI
uniref:Uncharacterized protein n=1 Tax=Cucumis melo TaxID=3656 RepID=A0A9I9E1Q0_CUCME